MSQAIRNRQIKKLLSEAFGQGKVTVRGSRGTGYGWVCVHIAYSPRNYREARDLRAHVSKLIAAGKIEIGTYGYDDPGSDYGYGKMINIDFDPCRERADGYGAEAWRQHLSAEDWDRVQGEPA